MYSHNVSNDLEIMIDIILVSYYDIENHVKIHALCHLRVASYLLIHLKVIIIPEYIGNFKSLSTTFLPATF